MNLLFKKMSNFFLNNKSIFHANIIDTFVKFSNQFIMVPIFLIAWDTNIYGSWLSLLAIIGTIQILLNSITETYSYDLANIRNRNIKLSYLTSDYLFLFIIASLLMFLFSFCIYYFNYVFLENEIYLIKTIYILIFLLISSLIDGLSSLKISTFRFLTKYNDYLFYNRLLIISKLFVSIFSLYILKFDPLKLTVTLLITSIIFYLFLNLKKELNLRLIINKINKQSFKKTFNKIFKRFLITSGSNFKYSYEILILSIFFLPQSLANTITLYTLARSLTFINSQLKLFFYEILSLEFTKKNNKKIIYNHNILIILSLTISIFFSFILYFFGKNIYEIWTLNKFNFDLNILLLFLISINLRLIWVDKSFLISIFNKLQNFSYINFLMVILFILITFLLVKNFGILGFGISLISYEMIMVFLAFYFHKKNFLDDIKN